MGYWFKAAQQFYYSAVNIIRTRSTSDRLVLGATDQTQSGSGEMLSVDGGSENNNAIIVRGRILGGLIHLTTGFGTTPSIVMAETGTDLTCTILTSASGTASAVGMYTKNNRLVFAHQCGANGTIRYLSISLDGVSCAWIQSESAP